MTLGFLYLQHSAIGCVQNASCAAEIGLVLPLLLSALALGIAWYLLRQQKIPTPAQVPVITGTPAVGRSPDPFWLIAKASGYVFFELDAVTRKIKWASDLAARFLGYETGELDIQESSFINSVHHADRIALRNAWRKTQAVEIMDIEIRMLHKDGQWRWLNILAVPIANEKKEISSIMGMVRSTQELHETQQELAEARRLETVGNLAAGIAHEFNNHLTPVRGFIELALDQLGPSHPSSEGLRTALDRVDYCMELVSQIRTYGHKAVTRPKPVDLAKILPSVIRVGLTMSPKRSRNVSLVEQWPADLPTIWVDPGQFQQALVHLIRNSIQAMPNGGNLKITAEKVTLTSEQCSSKPDARPGEFICVMVNDAGVGMSAKVMAHVFDPFFTTHGRATARGMGLSIVQGIIRQHNGWMEIDSAPGKGTRVMLYFPLERSNAVSGVDKDGTMSVLPAAPAGNLIVADDEEFIRDIIRRVFQNEGWKVWEAAETNTVVTLIRNSNVPIDLIILDLAMPGPTAEEIIVEIEKMKPGMKVLLISTFSDDVRVQELAEMENVEFLCKPFTPKEILSKVDDMMTEL